MLDVAIKFLVMACCAGLNAAGGAFQHNYRRFVMPVILAISVSFITHIWWVGLIVLPVIGTLCLGYFSGKNWGRALWLFLQAVMISIGLTITGHVSLIIMIPYVIGSGLLGGIYKNWYQPIGDAITGCYLGSIILFVH